MVMVRENVSCVFISCKFNNNRNTYISVKILLYIVVGLLKFMFMLTFLFEILPACHNDANGVKAGSNSKTTDKHTAECSKAAYLDVIHVCVMYKLYIQLYSQKYQSP